MKQLATMPAWVAAVATMMVLLSTGAAWAQSTGAGDIRASIIFAKNAADQFNSTLAWQVDQRQPDGSWRPIEVKTWRAGSGLPRRGGTNECKTSVGWLPNGTYGVRLRTPYPGRLIKGNVFQLDNKRCRAGRGKVRQNLFIHTEQGSGNVQCKDRPGDQICRWEYPRFNDYRSLGCIKLAPDDLADLVASFRARFSAETRHSLDKVQLRVVDGPYVAPPLSPSSGVPPTANAVPVL